MAMTSEVIVMASKWPLRSCYYLSEVPHVGAAVDILVLLELLHLDGDVARDVGDVHVPELHPQVVVLLQHDLT